MTWRIRLRSGADATGSDLPGAILTGAPRFQHDSMPNEIGLLLPTNNGAKSLIDAIVTRPDICATAILGLFLADPFLNLPIELGRLAAANIRWITNLPSIGQQDTDFEQQLTDVGLDFSREHKNIKEIKTQGFNTAVVVTDMATAKTAASLEPEAIIVLPRIADFAAGFPSLRQRRSIVQEISFTLEAAGWRGILLGLGENTELDHERQWPEALDGLLCRPQIDTLPLS